MRIPLAALLAYTVVAMPRSQPALALPGTCDRARPTAADWQTFVLSNVPASLRVPPGPHASEQMPEFQDTWLAGGWELRVDVSSDSTGAPFAEVGGPLPPRRVDVRECVDTIAGRPMRLVTFRQPSGELHGEYGIIADWPLAAGSWLRIGGVAGDSSTQRLLVDVVRTLRVDSAVRTVSKLNPHTPCPATVIDTRTWRRVRLRYAPASVLVPPDAEVKVSPVGQEEVLNWAHGSINFQYRLLRTPGWQLPRPEAVAVWCRMEAGGRDADVAVDTVLPGHGLPLRETRVFVRLRPGVVLVVESHMLNAPDNAPQQVAAVVESLQTVSP